MRDVGGAAGAAMGSVVIDRCAPADPIGDTLRDFVEHIRSRGPDEKDGVHVREWRVERFRNSQVSVYCVDVARQACLSGRRVIARTRAPVASSWRVSSLPIVPVAPMRRRRGLRFMQSRNGMSLSFHCFRLNAPGQAARLGHSRVAMFRDVLGQRQRLGDEAAARNTTLSCERVNGREQRVRE
jgi:hypothetical protein